MERNTPLTAAEETLYSPMWTNEKGDWVLVRDEQDEDVPPILLPFNVRFRSVRLIDLDAPKLEYIVQRMQDAGVKEVGMRDLKF